MQLVQQIMYLSLNFLLLAACFELLVTKHWSRREGLKRQETINKVTAKTDETGVADEVLFVEAHVVVLFQRLNKLPHGDTYVLIPGYGQTRVTAERKDFDSQWSFKRLEKLRCASCPDFSVCNPRRWFQASKLFEINISRKDIISK